MAKSPNLVWIDLEMTGLEPDKDKILEIATIITDYTLNIIAEGPVIVINQEKSILDNMNEAVYKMHSGSGLLKKIEEFATTIAQAEEATLSFIKKFVKEGESPLCGNSIWQDKQFLQRYMPTLNNYFHYRIVDVSTVKILAKGWFPALPEFIKNKNHRALDDIKESIEELKFYRKNVFKN